MKEVRAYTEEETRELFLEHVRDLVDYWNAQKVDRKEAIEGIAFSILTVLDGSTIALPGFRVSPICPEEDVKYYKKSGKNYYDESIDIAGCLHEHFYKK